MHIHVCTVIFSYVCNVSWASVFKRRHCLISYLCVCASTFLALRRNCNDCLRARSKIPHTIYSFKWTFLHTLDVRLHIIIFKYYTRNSWWFFVAAAVVTLFIWFFLSRRYLFTGTTYFPFGWRITSANMFAVCTVRPWLCSLETELSNQRNKSYLCNEILMK